MVRGEINNVGELRYANDILDAKIVSVVDNGSILVGLTENRLLDVSYEALGIKKKSDKSFAVAKDGLSFKYGKDEIKLSEVFKKGEML